MSISPVFRIIDANLNRLAEGLRLLEEVARLILNDAVVTQQLKSLRHDLIRGDLPFHIELLQSRDSAQDVGASLEVTGEPREKDLALIVVANFRRVQESLRVLEELAKLPAISLKLNSDKFKQARFELYNLEKTLIARLARKDKAKQVSGLYSVLDTQYLGSKSLIEVAGKIIQAGVKIIQLRDKIMSKKQLISVARELQILCKERGVLFIINDYLDIALAVKADGLHIGQEDLPVETARQLLPLDTLLGVSAATHEDVREAENAGADYIGVGSIFPTSSKNNIDVVGLERLKQIRLLTSLPLVAIGGINKNNAKAVLSAGADSICIINAILGAADINFAAREIIQIIEDKNEKTD